MFGFDMLDVLIGLVTVYLTFGIACTAFVEAISSIAGLRARSLRDGLNEFFDGSIGMENGEKKSFADAFYKHPLVRTLSRGHDGRPSYIPSEIVGQAVESLLDYGDAADGLREKLESLPGEKPGENPIKDLLLVFYGQAGGDVVSFREKVVTHFDASMERVSGWFKRRTQYLAIGISIGLVGLANVDSVDIAHSLALNPEARASLVKYAEQLLTQREAIEAELEKTGKSVTPSLEAAKQKTEAARDAYTKALSTIGNGGLKVGWEKWPNGLAEWLSKIAGLLVSALAVSLGAPFWFQVLQRFVKVRGAGGTTEKTPK